MTIDEMCSIIDDAKAELTRLRIVNAELEKAIMPLVNGAIGFKETAHDDCVVEIELGECRNARDALEASRRGK